MGAAEFAVRVRGKTANEAFISVVENAQWQYGHGGYTGTIAEKSSFVLLHPPGGENPRTFAERLLREDDPRVSDKWGPAGCVKTGPEEWLFFGLASS